MCPSTSWSLSSLTLNIVFGRASTISPSISIFSSFGTAVRLDEADVHRLRPLVADLLLVLHLGVLRQALEALAVDARVVDEEVAVALVRSDEAVALFIVEPLDGSGRHVSPFLRVPARSVKRIRTTAPACRSRAGLPDALRGGTLAGGTASAPLEGGLAWALLQERANGAAQILAPEQRCPDIGRARIGAPD